MKWRSFFFFLALSFFCEGQTFLLQTNLGNTTFYNPETRTNNFAPSGNANFIFGNDEPDIDNNCTFFLAGLNFNRTVQTYKVFDRGGRYFDRDFVTNEYTLDIGGLVRNKLAELPGKRSVFLDVALFVELGTNFTTTAEDTTLRTIITPHAPIGIYHYAWNYYLFYVSGLAQLGIELTDRVSFVAGVKPRVFFYEENIGAVDKPKFNWAPVKLNFNVGFQFRIL